MVMLGVFFLPRFILGFFFLELLLWFLLCLGFLLCFDVLFSGGFGLVGVFCPFSKKAVRLWEVFFFKLRAACVELSLSGKQWTKK